MRLIYKTIENTLSYLETLSRALNNCYFIQQTNFQFYFHFNFFLPLFSSSSITRLFLLFFKLKKKGGGGVKAYLRNKKKKKKKKNFCGEIAFFVVIDNANFLLLYVYIDIYP